MTEQLTSGVELMLAGMGIVFLFLTMLVLAIKLMSGMIQRYFPEAPALVRVKAGQTDDSAVIAAISSAVHHYRNTHKPQ